MYLWFLSCFGERPCKTKLGSVCCLGECRTLTAAHPVLSVEPFRYSVIGQGARACLLSVTGGAQEAGGAAGPLVCHFC